MHKDDESFESLVRADKRRRWRTSICWGVGSFMIVATFMYFFIGPLPDQEIWHVLISAFIGLLAGAYVSYYIIEDVDAVAREYVTAVLRGEIKGR